MINRNTVLSGGFKSLLSEALPAVASSAQIFANAPANTVGATVTIRGGTLAINWGIAPVLGAAEPTAPVATATNGVDYAEGTYDFEMLDASLKRARAIGSGVTSGWITYWGVV